MREPTSNLSLFRDLNLLEGVVGVLCWDRDGFGWKFMAVGLVLSSVFGYAILALEVLKRRAARSQHEQDAR